MHLPVLGTHGRGLADSVGAEYVVSDDEGRAEVDCDCRRPEHRHAREVNASGNLGPGVCDALVHAVQEEDHQVAAAVRVQPQETAHDVAGLEGGAVVIVALRIVTLSTKL